MKTPTDSGEDPKTELCCHFFRRANVLASQVGSFGLIGTNTITQGASRRGALDVILNSGRSIIFAEPDFRWPGQASLTGVIVIFGPNKWFGARTLGGHVAINIDSYLQEKMQHEPEILQANENQCFLGVHLGGTPGFIIEPELAHEWIEADARNAEVVFPFVGGDEICRQPLETPNRWIINFGEMSQEVAASYSLPFQHLVRLVRPLRATKNANKYPRMVHQWWKYWHSRHELYQNSCELGMLLIRARTTDCHAVKASPSNWVHTDGVIVFKLDDYADLAVIQSSFHGLWAERYSSSLDTRQRYIPTECFERFPRPQHRTEPYRSLGKMYDAFRQSVMSGLGVGTTKTYNYFHDPVDTRPDISKLRRLHVEMDNATAAAYGWTDLDLGHGFHDTKQGVRYTISEPARREVLARLLKLNHERYAEEVKQGLHEKKKPKATKGKKESKANTGAGSSLFFGEEDDA